MPARRPVLHRPLRGETTLSINCSIAAGSRQSTKCRNLTEIVSCGALSMELQLARKACGDTVGVLLMNALDVGKRG